MGKLEASGVGIETSEESHFTLAFEQPEVFSQHPTCTTLLAGPICPRPQGSEYTQCDQSDGLLVRTPPTVTKQV